MPIVTVSRSFGAGGAEVAARVAAVLGWTLLDNALVDAVAQRLGTTAEAVREREERAPSLAVRIADALAFGSPEIIAPAADEDSRPSDERMLAVTRLVIAEASIAGPVVLVGRGAQVLLGERPDAVHVLCYAPRAARIARVMARERLTPDTAAARVDEVNRARERYVALHFGREWLQPEHYHVCVNTDALGIDGAARVVVATVHERLGEIRATPAAAS